MIAVAVAAATRYLLPYPLGQNVTTSPAAKAPVPVSMAMRNIAFSFCAPFTGIRQPGDAALFLSMRGLPWMLNPSSRPTIPSRQKRSTNSRLVYSEQNRLFTAEVCDSRRNREPSADRVVGEPLSERTWRAFAASDKSPAIPKGAVPAVPTAREGCEMQAARSASISLASARKACLN